MTLNVLMSFNY